MKERGIMGTGLVGLIAGSTSKSFREKNAHLLNRPGSRVAVDVSDSSNNRLRQKTGPKLNKTEVAFYEWLQAKYGDSVRAQSITLLIANGCRYTPDFISLKLGMAWETKGFLRDDAAVKIKVAASAYPELKFFLVSKSKVDVSGWAIQEILP